MSPVVSIIPVHDRPDPSKLLLSDRWPLTHTELHTACSDHSFTPQCLPVCRYLGVNGGERFTGQKIVSTDDELRERTAWDACCLVEELTTNYVQRWKLNRSAHNWQADSHFEAVLSWNGNAMLGRTELQNSPTSDETVPIAKSHLRPCFTCHLPLSKQI